MPELEQLLLFPLAQLRQADIFQRILILREQKAIITENKKRHIHCRVSDTSFYFLQGWVTPVEPEAHMALSWALACLPQVVPLLHF